MRTYFKYGLFSIAALLTVMAVGLPEVQAATGDLVSQITATGAIAMGGAGMIFSDQLRFSLDQDLSQSTGTYNSTNIIDNGAPGTVYGAAAALTKDIGPGTPIPLLVQITETFTSGGAATLQIQVETDTAVGFSTNNEIIAQSRVYALAELVAGKQFEVPYLPDDCRQFVRVNYVIGGATTTAGKATAGIVHGRQTNS